MVRCTAICTGNARATRVRLLRECCLAHRVCHVHGCTPANSPPPVETWMMPSDLASAKTCCAAPSVEDDGCDVRSLECANRPAFTRSGHRRCSNRVLRSAPQNRIPATACSSPRSSSTLISSKRAFEPSDGPTTPRRSRRSMRASARLKPTELALQHARRPHARPHRLPSPHQQIVGVVIVALSRRGRHPPFSNLPALDVSVVSVT